MHLHICTVPCYNDRNTIAAILINRAGGIKIMVANDRCQMIPKMPQNDPKTPLFDPKIPLNLGIFGENITKNQ